MDGNDVEKIANGLNSLYAVKLRNVVNKVHGLDKDMTLDAAEHEILVDKLIDNYGFLLTLMKDEELIQHANDKGIL